MCESGAERERERCFTCRPQMCQLLGLVVYVSSVASVLQVSTNNWFAPLRFAKIVRYILDVVMF